MNQRPRKDETIHRIHGQIVHDAEDFSSATSLFLTGRERPSRLYVAEHQPQYFSLRVIVRLLIWCELNVCKLRTIDEVVSGFRVISNVIDAQEVRWQNVWWL